MWVASETFSNLSVIWQKDESQNGCFKKAKHAKISKKQTFLTPDTHTYCLFFGNFGMLCFVETSVLSFALLPYYRQIVVSTIPKYFLSGLLAANKTALYMFAVKQLLSIGISNHGYYKLAE